MDQSAGFQAGVIEGFFGKSWSWDARLSGVDFLRANGYQFYIYAPKSDPYLRRRWREPLPVGTRQQLQKLRERCTEQGILLGMGLTPFEIYLDYDDSARNALRSKVLQINEIDVDILCILFDDMRGDVDGLSALQGNIIADICAWSTARQFIVCPTYYSYDHRLAREFGLPPKAYLRDLGRIVDFRIDFFWTGEKVISDGYSVQHLAEVAADMRRKPFIWDNHSANDSKIRTQHLFLDPAVGSWHLPMGSAAGLAINPMNQAFLSRIALCGYQSLLQEPELRLKPKRSFGEICVNLCGASFGQQLLMDIEWLQKVGLSQMDDEVRLRLINEYGARKDDPYAQEIVDWLRGEYAFDPQCLTT